MLFTTKSAAQKREHFRKGLASGKLLQFPGAFNPLCAQMIERKGFDGIYISGADETHVANTPTTAMCLKDETDGPA